MENTWAAWISNDATCREAVVSLRIRWKRIAKDDELRNSVIPLLLAMSTRLRTSQPVQYDTCWIAWDVHVATVHSAATLRRAQRMGDQEQFNISLP